MSEPKHLRIFFDGTEITETPFGWDEITSSIKRVKDTNSIFITTEANLTFHEDGYTYLLNKYEDGFCTKVEVELQEYCSGLYEKFFQGIIFLRTAEIDRKQCTISVLIEDNSFYAKINNNKNLEVFPFAEQSKNGGVIAACYYVKVEMFNPNDGVYIGILVNPPYTGACYPVFNLFQYLITFMSDSTLQFDSILFGVGGDYEGLTVTCGVVLRQYITGTTETSFKKHFKKISFQQLFEEVKKKVDIGIFIDYSTFPPTLRIERASYLKDETVSFTALNIDDLKEAINVDELYSAVRLGSNNVTQKTYTSPVGLQFPADISFIGFKNEQFIVLGDCNIDRELDLVSNFIIDTNIIEDCVIDGEDQYDDELFFIMCSVTHSFVASYTATQDTLQQDGTGTPPVFYNMELNNKGSTENYFAGIPNAIIQYLGNADLTFRATKTDNQFLSAAPAYTVIEFQDDTNPPNYNPSGNYDGLSKYTIANGGLYSFAISVRLHSFSPHPLFHDIPIYLERYDSGMSLIVRYVIDADYIYSGGYNVVVNGNISISAAATDIILVSIVKLGVPIVTIGSIFWCTASQIGGGAYGGFDPNDYPAIKHEWEYPLTQADFKTISENQTQRLEFSRSGEKHYNGWIDSVKYKRFKEEKAQFVTYTSKNMIK